MFWNDEDLTNAPEVIDWTPDTYLQRSRGMVIETEAQRLAHLEALWNEIIGEFADLAGTMIGDDAEATFYAMMEAGYDDDDAVAAARRLLDVDFDY